VHFVVNDEHPAQGSSPPGHACYSPARGGP